jgi:AraC-like DNA-binding protein
MAREGCASRAVMVSATPLPQAAGATIHWDGRSGVCREVGPLTCSGPEPRSSFQVMSQPATGDGARPYWTTSAIGLVPSVSPQAIAWEQEAALVTFDLDPVLLTDAAHEMIRGETGGLAPYKLRRTTAYIQAHLAQELSLATLAAVAQTSPAHFARLFKHATGLAPPQYVLRSRMAHARRLLAATDVSLIDIGLQVGCGDLSHFTALFRTHVSVTPKAIRDHARCA